MLLILQGDEPKCYKLFWIPAGSLCSHRYITDMSQCRNVLVFRPLRLSRSVCPMGCVVVDILCSCAPGLLSEIACKLSVTLCHIFRRLSLSMSQQQQEPFHKRYHLITNVAATWASSFVGLGCHWLSAATSLLRCLWYVFPADFLYTVVDNCPVSHQSRTFATYFRGPSTLSSQPLQRQFSEFVFLCTNYE